MIRRAERKRNFTTVSNTFINDERLSFKAKGLLMYLLSKPDNWTANETQLAQAGPDGTTAVRTALNELKGCGYLVSRRLRDKEGKFCGWEQVIDEEPQAGDEPASGETDLWEIHGEDNERIINTVVKQDTVCNKNRSASDDADDPPDVIEVYVMGEVVDTIKQPKPLSDWQELLNIVTFCVHGHDNFSALSKTEQGKVLSECKAIKSNGYDHEDVRVWWRRVWYEEWKWTAKNGGKIRRPRPDQIRSGLPVLDGTKFIDAEEMERDEKMASLPPSMQGFAEYLNRGR